MRYLPICALILSLQFLAAAGGEGKDDDQLIRYALSKLDDKDPWVRVEAVRTLGKTGKKQYLSSIKPLLSDDHIDVNLEAVKAIENIRDPDTLHTLLIVALSHDLSSVRYYALRAAYVIDKERTKKSVYSWLISGHPIMVTRAMEAYVHLNTLCNFKDQKVLKMMIAKASSDTDKKGSQIADTMLQQILGVSFADDPHRWKNWLKENEEKTKDGEGEMREIASGKPSAKKQTPEEVAEEQKCKKAYEDFRKEAIEDPDKKKDDDDLPHCRAYFSGRKEKGKEVSLKFFKGEGGSLKAVEEALNWLMRHQSKNGSWGYRDYLHECSGTPDDPETIKGDYDVAATGLALLAFLGAGHTHTAGRKEVSMEGDDKYGLPPGGKFKPTIARGLSWLVSIQDKEGSFKNPNRDGKVNMFEQAIATLAVSEAYGMTRDPQLAAPAAKAIAFISKARNKDAAWRYTPNCGDNDTSVVGWQVFALKSSAASGLKISHADLAAASKWLDDMTDFSSGKVGYSKMGEGSTTITAIAVICRMLLGWRNDAPLQQKGAEIVLADKTWAQGEKSNYYHLYQASLAMFQMGGSYWEEWNNAMSAYLLSRQVKGGCEHGSWASTEDKWSKSRVYSTALAALSLEVYYRYLPFYR